MSCRIDFLYKRNIDYEVSDLARFCGTSPQNIYNILDSKTKPNIYLALKILDYFRIHHPDKKGQLINRNSLERFFVFDQETL